MVYASSSSSAIDSPATRSGARRRTLVSSLHAGAWKRTAVVSDLGWVIHLATAFGWMVPGKFKRFPLAEQDAAIAWVAEQG